MVLAWLAINVFYVQQRVSKIVPVFEGKLLFWTALYALDEPKHDKCHLYLQLLLLLSFAEGFSPTILSDWVACLHLPPSSCPMQFLLLERTTS